MDVINIDVIYVVVISISSQNVLLVIIRLHSLNLERTRLVNTSMLLYHNPSKRMIMCCTTQPFVILQLNGRATGCKPQAIFLAKKKTNNSPSDKIFSSIFVES